MPDAITTDHYEGAAEIERAWREGLTPDPLLTVSEWSDRPPDAVQQGFSRAGHI